MNKRILNEIVKKFGFDKDLIIFYKPNAKEREYLSSYDIYCKEIEVELNGLIADFKVSHTFYRYYKY